MQQQISQFTSPQSAVNPDDRRPDLSQRRAAAIAVLLEQQGIAATPAPAAGALFRLASLWGMSTS